MVRCFVNIELNKEQIAAISALIEKLAQFGRGVKFVDNQHLHLTLNFLGEVPEAKIMQLKKEFEDTLAGEKQFQMSLKGVGAFPDMKTPRVLWVGVEQGAQETTDLAGKFWESITVGNPDDKRFHPHITIGRVKNEIDEKLQKKLKEFEKTEFGVCTVDKVNIKKSTLTPKGPVYEKIAETKLAL